MARAASTKDNSTSQPSAKKQKRVVPPLSSSDDNNSDQLVGGDSDNDNSSASSSKPAKKLSKGKAKAAPKEKKKVVKKDGKAKKPVKGKKRKADSDDEDDFIAKSGSEDDDDDDDDDGDDSDGGLNTRVVGSTKKVAGPTEDAETSVLLPTTLQFLRDLAKPNHNDRDWFQLHDNRYRHAQLNFKTFITAWVPKATEADWSLPHLPAKDLMQRIYRDVRFSKDKTPYKTYLSASTSRTGRKGPFGLYYVQIQPGGKSLLGCGCWGPGTTELKAIRAAILRDPKPLRKVLAQPKFVELFGEPKPRMDKKPSSIFGRDDQLKNAPKLEGVDKNHKDIDLLKCRSFAVSTHFDDDVVTADNFLDVLCEAMKTAAPFVHLLNDIISPPEESADEGDANEGSEEGGEEGEEGEEEEEEEE